jgi:hypothetical protein
LTDALISASFALHPHLEQQDAATWLAERIPQTGWAPRDVFTKSLSSYLNRTKLAVESLDFNALRRLMATVKHATADFPQKAEGEQLSHRITAFYRSPDQDLTLTDSSHKEKSFIDIKSPFVATALRAHFHQLSGHETRTLFRQCRAFPQSAILASWVFGYLAMNIIQGLDTRVELPPPGLMPHVSSSVKGQKHEWDRSVTVDPSVTLAVPSQPLPQRPLRDLLQKSMPGPVKDFLFVLSATNSPLFDAVIVSQAEPSILVINVLQMTIARHHLGSVKGYELLKTIWMRLKQRYGNKVDIKFRYYLVVPYVVSRDQDADQHPIVAWTLPSGMPPILNGEVFVQHIPTDVEVSQFGDLEPLVD